MTPVIEQKHPQGMVLVFTLCILALLMILGATIFMSTKDEVYVTSDLSASRDAFTKADLTAHITVFLARADLNFTDLKVSLSPGGVDGRPKFVVDMNNFSDKIKLDKNTSALNTRNRYVLAADGNPNLDGDETKTSQEEEDMRPHVTVHYQYGNSDTQRQLVGSASIATGHPAKNAPGSLQEGKEIPTFLVVTADGRIPTRGQDLSSPPEDPANYFTGDPYAKHAIVATIYKEVPQ